MSTATIHHPVVAERETTTGQRVGSAVRTAVRFTGNLVLAAAEVLVLGKDVEHGPDR